MSSKPNEYSAKYSDQGAWKNNRTYYPDQVVIAAGKLYVCIQAHHSSGIAVTNTSYWQEYAPIAANPVKEWIDSGGILKPNNAVTSVQNAIQVKSASGATQGFVGFRRTPDPSGQFKITTDGDFAMKGIQLYETFQGAGAANFEARNLLNHYVQISNTNRFVRIATNMSFPTYGYLTLSLNTVSANSSIQFTHQFEIGVGLGDDFQASYTGTQTGHITNVHLYCIMQLRGKNLLFTSSF